MNIMKNMPIIKPPNSKSFTDKLSYILQKKGFVKAEPVKETERDIIISEITKVYKKSERWEDARFPYNYPVLSNPPAYYPEYRVLMTPENNIKIS